MTSRTRLVFCGAGFLLAIVFAILLLEAPPDGVERGELAQFIGRFHPLAVHLPITLVLLAAVLECAGLFNSGKHLQSLAGFVLALAAASALIAVSLGWLLGRSGGYEGELVTRHMWGGVSLAAVLVLCGGLRGWNARFYSVALCVAVCLMVWTADQGGKLTHGTNFLTEHMPAQLRGILGVPPPPPQPAASNPASTVVSSSTPAAEKVPVAFFTARVAPIFEDRCTTCHGPEKKKGKLRLDTFENVMRGGKDGVVVRPGDPKGSELFRRINLPRNHKDAMPAEGKPGLTAAQIKVIEFWIASGAAQTVAADVVREALPLPPPKPVVPPPATDYRPRSEKIQALKSEFGIQLVPRSQDPRDGLILRTVSAPERCNDGVLAALEPIADLIVDAELARTRVTDEGMKTLGSFPNLLSLDLSHTAITSHGLAPLQNLKKLESLNLTGTNIDEQGLQPLRHKPGLRHLYFFETGNAASAGSDKPAHSSAPKSP
jgi:uncharacterized membrane protein